MPPRQRVSKVRAPRPQAAVDDRDNGFRRLVADLGAADGAAIEVGVFGPKAMARHPDSGLTVGQLATLHEFGLGGQEPRPAVGQWTDRNEAEIRARLFQAVRFAIAGSPLRFVLEGLGKEWADEVRAFILSGSVRPLNAPDTVAWKGHGRPLEGRTGALADAVTHKVTLRGGAARALADLLDSALGVGGKSVRIRGRK